MNIYAWTRAWALDEGLKLWAEERVESTNSVAKDDASPITLPVLDRGEDVSAPTLYLANHQSGGRGRGDHVWTTPPGSLLSSWSFALARVPQPIFSPLAGLALFEAALETWPEIAFNLKAPNDLFIDKKKVAGILIETIDRGPTRHTVVGVGLNVTASPPEIETATSITDHLKTPLTEATWRRFLSAWASRLREALHSGQRDGLSPSACERLKGALNRHPLLREPILEVDERGQLRSSSRVIYWHEL